MRSIVFVSDFFVEHYHGGAELTMQAIMDACPPGHEVIKIQSHLLTPELVNKYDSSYWILVNFSGCSQESLIEIVVQELDYSIIECDYKYCKYRSSHLHFLKENKQCDCQEQRHPGLFVRGLMRRAHKVFFMSQGHLDEYLRVFGPKFGNINNFVVQVSTWSQEHLDLLEKLSKTPKNGKWAVLGGASWIKNQSFCEDKLRSDRIPYDVIGGLPYEQFLEKLSQYKGLCFHPLGFDTCPRIVIEARLMGLELDLGELVQHTKDTWWTEAQSPEQLSAWLRFRPQSFWKTLGDIERRTYIE